MTSGSVSAMTAAAFSTSSEKSWRRGVGIHSVRVPAAMIGCIEYDGVKPSAVRPAPPKACRICWSTSLEPFAAQICSGRSAPPLVRER